MSLFVLDNSVSAAWCFADQATSYTTSVLRWTGARGGPVAPALWPLELANALLVGERRKLITTERRLQSLEEVLTFDIEIRPQSTSRVLREGMRVGAEHQRSAYDAAYLDLAAELGLALATKDAKMQRAAEVLGIGLFLPPSLQTL